MKSTQRLLSIVTGIFISITIFTTQTFAIQYTYDDLNRLVSVEYDDGTTIDYIYDSAGNRLQKIVSPSGVFQCDFNHDCDVDGSDLATFINNGVSTGPYLSTIASEFGRTDCP